MEEDAKRIFGWTAAQVMTNVYALADIPLTLTRSEVRTRNEYSGHILDKPELRVHYRVDDGLESSFILRGGRLDLQVRTWFAKYPDTEVRVTLTRMIKKPGSNPIYYFEYTPIGPPHEEDH